MTKTTNETLAGLTVKYVKPLFTNDDLGIETRKSVERPDPFIYEPAFLPKAQADHLFDFLMTLKTWQPESGANNIAKSIEEYHDSIQWGRRQAYTVSKGALPIKSSGARPAQLVPLTERVENYCFQSLNVACPINSIQANRHLFHLSKFTPHSDAEPGAIPMLSLGAERRFRIAGRSPNKAGQRKIYFDGTLAHGSLLTLLPSAQWGVTHELVAESTPFHLTQVWPRIALIFRYIPKVLVHSASLTAAQKAERDAEYKKAQEDWTAKKEKIA